MSRVYLSKYDGWAEDYPWHLASSVEEGGSHRLDISTDLRFECQVKGITLCWSFDLEPRSACGSGEYHIDSAGVADVIGKLNPLCAVTMKRILADAAVKVKARADDYMRAAQKQYGDAAVLETLSKEGQ
jgi:hypothetical protein